MNLFQYFDAVNSALEEDEIALGALFGIGDFESEDFGLLVLAAEKNIRLEQECVKKVKEPYGLLVYHHLATCVKIKNDQLVPAIENQMKLFQEFLNVFSKEEDNYLLPMLSMISRDTRQLAADADEFILSSTGKKSEKHLTDVVSLLNKAFKLTINHRPDDPSLSKRKGCLEITIQMVRAYFGLNMLRSARETIKPLLNTLQHNHMGIEDFPLADQVTYHYFNGALFLMESKLQSANQELTFAFERCHKDYEVNLKAILWKLIPIRVLMGQLPSVELLEKHEMVEYLEIIHAIRRGDVDTFDMLLMKYQILLIKKGVLIAVQKSRSLCVRNLIKHVSEIIGESLPVGKKHLQPIRRFLPILQNSGLVRNEDDIVCLLSSLMYKKIVKGYINVSQKTGAKTLVLSKKDAFPNVEDSPGAKVRVFANLNFISDS